QENQQHDQDVDEGDNDNRGGLSSFASVETHWGKVMRDAWPAALDFGLHALDFFPMLAAEEFIAKRFHFDRDRLDLLGVVTPEDERGDGDQQTEERRAQDQRDAFGQLRGVDLAGGADFAEGGHHAEDRADQAEQRGDAHDDLQHNQAAVQTGHFLAGAGLDSIDGLGFGPIEMLGGEQQQAADGGVVLLADAPEHRHVLGRLAGFDGGLNFPRHDAPPAQGKGALDDEGQADHRGHKEQDIDNRFHR